MNKRDKERAKNILYKWGSSRILLEFEKSEAIRIKNILSDMIDISQRVYSHTPVAVSNESPVERKLIKSMDLCEKRLDRINKRINEYIEEEGIINNIVSNMEFDREYIIRAKYAEGQTWDNITKNYPYDMSLRNFYRIHNEAIEEFYNKYKEARNKIAV